MRTARYGAWLIVVERMGLYGARGERIVRNGVAWRRGVAAIAMESVLDAWS
jgi:hypothetical protein